MKNTRPEKNRRDFLKAGLLAGGALASVTARPGPLFPATDAHYGFQVSSPQVPGKDTTKAKRHH